MKLTLKIGKALLRLMHGESLPASSAKGVLIDQLVAENIVIRSGKHHKTLSLPDAEALETYLHNQLQIQNLSDYVFALGNEKTSRAEFAKISTDSKDSKERVFKGFLVNSYQSILAELNGEEFIVNPISGSFSFIYDWESFKIPRDVTVVGVENAENFRWIQQQKYLFDHLKPLFISRYPQSQSKDFIRWMQTIPNPYLHYGDFDLAGINIYCNEYKKHLGNRATFFMPPQIETDLKKWGNRERYVKQKQKFKRGEIDEPQLLQLIDLIKSERKGLDQEVYIKQ